MPLPLRILTTAIVSCLILASCILEKVDSPDSDTPAFSLQPGDSLPHFSIEMNSGATISTDSLRGRQTFLLLFSTSCPDCRDYLPVVQRFHELCPEALILAISREESAQSLIDYWNRHDLTIPYSVQTSREIYELFAPSGIPRLYISGPDLTITHAYSPEKLPDCSTLLQIAASPH